MIATKLEESSYVLFLILYVKHYIFMVNVIHSRKILSEGFKILIIKIPHETNRSVL